MSKSNRVFQDDITADLFAGFPVSDYHASLSWYTKLLGCAPSFFPNEIEAVWELSEHRFLYIKVVPELAGRAFSLIFLNDLDRFINQVSERGIKPKLRETLQNGVRKTIYCDPDGNELGFGGSPLID